MLPHLGETIEGERALLDQQGLILGAGSPVLPTLGGAVDAWRLVETHLQPTHEVGRVETQRELVRHPPGLLQLEGHTRLEALSTRLPQLLQFVGLQLPRLAEEAIREARGLQRLVAVEVHEVGRYGAKVALALIALGEVLDTLHSLPRRQPPRLALQLALQSEVVG